MVEAGAKEVSEDEMVIALDTAHKAIKDIIAGTTELAAKVNKPKLKVSKREMATTSTAKSRPRCSARWPMPCASRTSW